MAYRGRSRSPPRHSSAPRFADVGASEHAAEKDDEANIQNHKEDVAEDEDEVPSMADFTHLAATILDQAMRRFSASTSKHAGPRNKWFINLKRDVIDATRIPLTRDDLERRSAKGPGKRPRTGGVWPTTMETISRSVAAYNKYASAANHDSCDEVVVAIGAYAHTLRMRTHRPHEFIKMLHQWIENRSINVALKETLKGASEAPCGMFTEQTVWRLCNAEERVRATEILAMSLEIVRASGDRIREDIRVQHESN